MNTELSLCSSFNDAAVLLSFFSLSLFCLEGLEPFVFPDKDFELRSRQWSTL